MDNPADAGEDTVLLALLPFVEPGAGRHIESLQLSSSEGYNTDLISGERLVCMLVPLLPNLRNLDFRLRECMSNDQFDQQLMFSALASLPRLERLTLPGCRSLDLVGALAASLRCLTISDIDGEYLLSPAAIAGMLQLQRLEELELPYCCWLGAESSGSEVASSSGIQALLRSSLPPSLQKLKVGLVLDGKRTVLILQLHAGSLSRMTFAAGVYLELPGLIAMAQLLLCSPAMGPTLELLSIEQLGMLESKLEDRQEADQLYKLLRRCVQVQTGDVYISSTMPAAAVMGLLPLLGPDEVVLPFDRYYDFCFRFPSASGKMTGISGPTAGMDTRGIVSSSPEVAALPSREGEGLCSQQCSPPPEPADLLRAALQRMAFWGGPSSSSSQQAASSNAEGGALPVPVTGSSGTSGTPERSLLLLQGPLVAMMAKSGLAPTEWVRCLAAQADAAAPGNDWGGKPVLSCQAVPLVNGVLLACSSATAAAGVAAAAEAAAVAAAAPVPLLEVMAGLPLLSADMPDSAKTVLFDAVELVMTAFWEGSAFGGESCTQQERLKCMLALRDAFNALPEVVNL